MEHMVQRLEVAELKFADDGANEMTFEGYGAVFGNTDSHGDVIVPGAFRKTLREARGKAGRMPAMLLQHGFANDDLPIGIWTEMSEDDVGLKVAGKLADTQRGREAYQLLKMKPRPAIDGLSIGYRARKFTMGTKPDEPRRKLEDIDLLEVSLVTFPANTMARVSGVKSIVDMTPQELRDLEEAYRDGGFSRSDAVKAVSVLKKWAQRDAESDPPQNGPRDEAQAALAELLRRNLAKLTGGHHA